MKTRISLLILLTAVVAISVPVYAEAATIPGLHAHAVRQPLHS